MSKNEKELSDLRKEKEVIEKKNKEMTDELEKMEMKMLKYEKEIKDGKNSLSKLEQ